jgi:hypothetical protein
MRTSFTALVLRCGFGNRPGLALVREEELVGVRDGVGGLHAGIGGGALRVGTG